MQRLCAEGDGATGYVTFPNGAISGVAGSDWSLAVIVKANSFVGSDQVFGTFDTTGITKRFYLTTTGTITVRIGTGASQDISPVGYMTAGTTYLIMLQYNNSTGVITSKFKNMTTGTITNGTDYTVVGLTELNDNVLGVFNNANGAASFFNGCISNLRIWFSSVSFTNMEDVSYATGCNLCWESEGHLYDTSGNDYHGTIVGDVDLTATTINTSGIYSPNLNNGFDLYFDTATGLIPLYVPYRNGVPVVASVAGYTLYSSNPSGKWNNVPACSLLFTEAIMDKSDTSIWEDTIRALDSYNALLPKKWDCNELTLSFFRTHMKSTIYNRLFVADNESIYVEPFVKVGDLYTYSATGEVLKRIQNFLIYNAIQTEPKLLKETKWIANTGRKGI